MTPRKTATVRLTREQLLGLLDGGRMELYDQSDSSSIVLEGAPPAPWQPLTQIEVPEHIIEQQQQATGEQPDQMWRNDEYEVMVYGPLENGATHLSIKRYDRAPIRNWRHMQQIKNEVIDPEIEAIELYPRESRVVDNANQYHLWAAPPGADWPVGWETGMVLRRESEVKAYNDAPHGGRQEPMQEGLTIGEDLDKARTPEQDEEIRRILNG